MNKRSSSFLLVSLLFLNLLALIPFGRCAYWTDNFNDNSKDAKWDFHKYGSSSVAETNQQVECTSAAEGTDWRNIGYVSNSSYDLQNHYVEVDVVEFNIFDYCYLQVALNYTSDEYSYNNPSVVSDHYFFFRDRNSGYWYVERLLDGSKTSRGNGITASYEGKLKINITDTTIYFYDDDVLKFSESYALGDYNLYVYFGFLTNNNGVATDSIDDFLSDLSLTANQPTYHSVSLEDEDFKYDEYKWFNASVSHNVAWTDIVNVTLGFDNGVILKWDNATDTFSEYSDSSDYVSLNVSDSEMNVINSTHIEVCFNLDFNNPCPLAYRDIIASDTVVWDDGASYANYSSLDCFYLWNTTDILAVDYDLGIYEDYNGFQWGFSNNGETILREDWENSTLMGVWDNATFTTRSLSDFGSSQSNYATLYIVFYVHEYESYNGFVWGWSSTIYDIYRNQSYECIGEAGYQDWLYNGLFHPPTFSESYPSDVMPWYVPIIGYLAAVLLPFMIIAYYWNKARDWKTGLMVLFVCIMCYILFLTLWNLSDALMYWVYR